MYLKTRISRGIRYLTIMEAYWDKEAHRSKERVVCSLGREDQLDNKSGKNIGIKLLMLSGNGHLVSDILKIETENTLHWGITDIYRKIWDDYLLDEFLNVLIKNKHPKIKYDPNASIFNIVLTRLLSPCSKLQVYKKQNSIIGLDPVNLKSLYKVLDILSESKGDLEEYIYSKNIELNKMNVDIVFYDVTTLYFESERADELRNFGYSKDCKFGEVQIVLGMTVDRNGLPISYDIFNGKTYEGKTLLTAINKFKERFNLQRIIIVADRGINNKDNLIELEKTGYEYIVGSRLKNKSKTYKELILDNKHYRPFKNEEEISYQEIEYINDIKTPNHEAKLKERLICTYSKKRADKDKRDRETFIKKAKELIESGKTTYYARGARKYLKLKDRAQQKDNKYEINLDKIRDDEKWDGFYGIETNTSLPPEELLSIYNNLWRIERTFRDLKSHLEIRPIYVRKQMRIEGHIICCFLSYFLERTLEFKLREGGLNLSLDTLQEELSSLQLTLINLDDQKYRIYNHISDNCKKILKTLNIPIPRSCELLK